MCRRSVSSPARWPFTISAGAGAGPEAPPSGCRLYDCAGFTRRKSGRSLEMASYADSVPEVGSSDSVMSSRLDEAAPEAAALAEAPLAPAMGELPEAELLLE